MTGTPFNSINLGADGLRAKQIRLQLIKAKRYSPKNLFILAGTNDILGHREDFNLTSFSEDYRELVTIALNASKNVIVTLIPYTSKEIHIPDIIAANKAIVEICDENIISVIDLNEVIAPEGILLKDYSNDGLHLNKKGNQLWLERVDFILDNQ